MKKSNEVPAYVRELQRAFDQYAQMNKKLPKEVLKSVTAIEDPSRLVDMICSHLQLQTKEKQGMLVDSVVSTHHPGT